MAKLADRLKISLDELRMQVLGAQVLFGFQFRNLFQPGFARATDAERLAAAAGIAAILVSLTILLVPPVQHRIAAAGQATRRMLELSNRCAEIALATMILTLASIAFAIAAHRRIEHPLPAAVVVAGVALIAWFGWGWLPRRPGPPELPEYAVTDLHTKIDQMLTEARVILPGAQATLGFQLIVVMTEAFEQLPDSLQRLHLAALALDTLSILLLIAPAAAHRMAFHGNDDERFHRLGSILVSVALAPLALAITAEVFIAFWKLFASAAAASAAAAITLVLAGYCWFGLPWTLRSRGAR
jgi:Family of unknown function (DUF6328)